MWRSCWVVTLLALGATAATAASLEDQLEERLLGAWLLTAVDTRSDCASDYTDNRVNGALVNGRGRFAFAAGELGKVVSVDARRSRLDLRIQLAEPVLAARHDGPFTLYDELRCRIELEIELPREAVKARDVSAILARVAPVFRPFAGEREARADAAHNRRARDPYPDDYEDTLAEYEVFRAERFNAGVQAALERHREEATRAADRVQTDPDYVSGLAAGLEEGRSAAYGDCDRLISRSPAPAQAAPPKDETPQQRRYRAGRADGITLALGLDGLKRLPACFVEVPRHARRR